MKKLFYVLILILFWGCSGVKQNSIKLIKGKAVIAGNVKNFPDSSRVLRFTSFGVVKDINQIAILDSLGNFSTEIELSNSQDVGLDYENSFVTLYLHPSDSLYLNIDANLFKKDAYPYYEITGNHSTTSINIRDYSISHTPFLFDPEYKLKYQMPLSEFMGDIKKHLSIEDSVLQKYYNRNKPTNEFMSWERNYILYNSFSLFMNYFAINAKTHKEYKAEIFNSGLFSRDNSAISNSIYIWFLSQYPIMKYSAADSIAMQLIKKHQIKDSFAWAISNLMKNEKPGLSRDIMIYKLFDMFDGKHGFSIKDGVALYEKYKPNIKSYITNKVLISRLSENISYFSNSGGKETISDLILKTKSESISKFWKTLEGRNKNKILYLDFWATWCAPCRAQLPYTIELSNYYKDKPVAIIMICLSSNKNDWREAKPKINNASDNYFFNKDESKIIEDELKISGFPTHMIIDKKGKLITENVNSPTSKKIKIQLNKLLEE